MDEAKPFLARYAPKSGRPSRLPSRKATFALTSLLVLFCLLTTFAVPRDRRVQLFHKASPYSGAFSRFPPLSGLAPKYRRITLVVHWTHDAVPDYLHGFLHSAQRNADVLDVLFINRVLEPGKSCVDFAKAGIDVTWGGNIKQVCMSMDEWNARLTDVLCHADAGWACSPSERASVQHVVQRRPDVNGWEWKPFRGPMYRDLFLQPDNPLWAWIDLDSFVGDFRHFPFNLLAKSSFITFSPGSAQQARMFGQLTAFNMDDVALQSAWRGIPTLRTPREFIHDYVPSNEEQEWSYRYMNVDEGSPGRNLTFMQLADAQADDFFDLSLDTDAAQTALRENMQVLVSGRDVIVANTLLAQRDAEALVVTERDAHVAERGWDKWSLGYDGSDAMLDDPSLSMHDAVRGKSDLFRGRLESIQWRSGQDGCPDAWWIPAQWRICVTKEAHVPFQRTSFVHFADHRPGYLFARKESDSRPRGHARYLIKHTLRSKQYPWLQMPAFNITDQHVFALEKDRLHVWRVGSNEVVFNRQADGNDRIG